MMSVLLRNRDARHPLLVPLSMMLLLLVDQFGASIGSESTGRDEAFVTLLYEDEFLLGVRVLGKSIQDTGTTKDMVVLVSDGVSEYAKKLLKADGWIVEKITLLANPNQVRPKRFWGVYTKLKIFNMTKHKKVVWINKLLQGLMSNDQEVAVKKLSLTSRRGMREFMNEVKLLLKIQHKNLVMLLGCCVKGPEKMLVLTVNSRMPTIFFQHFYFYKLYFRYLQLYSGSQSCTLNPKIVIPTVVL